MKAAGDTKIVPICVLIVLEDRTVGESIGELLPPETCEVYLAGSAAAAEDVLRREEIGVIVSDQRLPDRPGAELLAAAAQIRPDSMRIALVEHGQLPQSQRHVDEGIIDRMVLKPWSFETVAAAVEQAVSILALREENQRLRERVTLAAGGAGGSGDADAEARMEAALEDRVAHATKAVRSHLKSLEVLQAETERTMRGIAGLMLKTLEHERPGSELHAKRVSIITVLLGRAMDLRGRDMARLQLGALSHEIGWTASMFNGQPDERLDEDGAMARGRYLLGSVPGLREVGDAIGTLTESFDGTGKHHLAGEAIPLWARIIAVADAFDHAAHAEASPGRADIAGALREICTGSGSKFDPAIVTYLSQLDFDRSLRKTVWEQAQVPVAALTPGLVLATDITWRGEKLLAAGSGLTQPKIEKLRSLHPDDPAPRIRIVTELRLPSVRIAA